MLQLSFPPGTGQSDPVVNWLPRNSVSAVGNAHFFRSGLPKEKLRLGVKTENIHSTSNATSRNHHGCLSAAWLDFWRNPQDTEALDRLGVEIDEILRRFLSRRGHETPISWQNDVIQEAGKLIYWRYLAGNKRLTDASQRADRAEIENQIRAAAWTSVRTTVREFRRRFRAYGLLFDSSSEPEDHPENSCIHPAQKTDLRQLSLDDQIKLVDRALRIAALDGSLTAVSVEIARTLLNDGCTQTELAQARGVTRQSISQRLAPVREYLREAVHSEEFPLS